MKIFPQLSRILGLALLLLAFGSARAQITTCANEQVNLTLTGYTGLIQWEYSTSPSGPFAAIPGVTGDNAVLTPVLGGWYRAAVTDGTCDPFYSDTLELVVHPAVIADAGPNVSICVGEGATIGGSPSGSGGTAPYTFNWTPASDLDNPTSANPFASPANFSIYVLSVTDANGCVDQDSMLVYVNGLPQVNAGADDTIPCGTDVALQGTASGLGPFTYQWQPAGDMNNPNVDNPIASPSGSTNYLFTVTDTNGCSATDSVMITVVGATSGSDTLFYTGTIDTSFVVPPCAGTLTIEVWGAQGGSNTSSSGVGGSGAYQRGEFTVPTGTRLKVIVGQFPGTASNGGGGGTFVTYMNNTPLIVAGGGGGSGAANDVAANKNGQAGTTGATGTGGGGVGGTAGNGGSIGASFASGAGGGLLTNGQDGWTPGSGGFAFVNGGAGANVGFGIGGFGGGGNGSGYVVGGGGGGYSGGGSASNSVGGGGFGGGGGSYNSGTNPVSTSGVNLGNGRVVISW